MKKPITERYRLKIKNFGGYFMEWIIASFAVFCFCFGVLLVCIAENTNDIKNNTRDIVEKFSKIEHKLDEKLKMLEKTDEKTGHNF